MTKVLVVEDDADLLYLYRTALAQAGYEVNIAESGREAFTALQEGVPDLVFLDMNMPDVHGMDVIDYIRGDARWAATRIVVITANEKWQAPAEARDVALFMVKPVTIRDVVAVANRLTGA